MDRCQAAIEWWVQEDVQVFLDGSTGSFRCKCGCNVFRRHANKLRFRCNACGEVYEGEARHG